jgi:hypothetical protein
VSFPELNLVNEVKKVPMNIEFQRSANQEVVLEELFELLEEYGPSWYTEEHHRRVLAALRAPGQANPHDATQHLA